MLLILPTMGCGRSKQHSPKLCDEERLEHNITKEKQNNKKRKLKGENKENKENKDTTGQQKAKSDTAGQQKAKTDTVGQQKTKSKLSPVKNIVNSLKPPPPNLNGSPKQTPLHLDIEYPTYKHKEMDRLAVPINREVKEFRGKQNIRVTHSQIAFFEMLDKKIEQGDDYHSEHSIEITTPDDS